MSTARRIIPITLDAETADRRVIDGTTLNIPDSNQQMNLYYGTQILFEATLLSGAVTTAFQPDPTATWLWGLDDIPFSDAADYVLSQNDQFNIPGDWADLNVAAGKISWRANLATDELKAGLNKLSALYGLMYANLWMLTASGNVVWSWPVYVHKVHVDPTTAVPVDGITHLTTQAAAASYVPIWGDSAYVRRRNGRDQDLFPDGKWRSRICVIIDGKPTQTWGDPED
jgi:hypothetical protein